ncbi:MAG: flagellar biosynthesis protein FlhB [Sedimentisphaerales bacterium]
MAEQSAAERTEQPTPRRIQKARGKGQVPQSTELTSVVMLAAMVAAIVLLSRSLAGWAAALTVEGLSCQSQIFTNSDSFINFINAKMADSFIVILPVLAALMAGATVAGLFVSGPNFAPEALTLRLDALNPISGFQQLFNGRSGVKLIISIAKLIAISIILWVYLKDQLGVLMNLRWAQPIEIVVITSRIILGVCIRICILLLIVAIADVFYQKWKYIDELKMTRQEVKQELRDTEGAPEVKGRIRRLQIQISMKRMLQDVPKAKVILVNPTHVAVALQYDPPEMAAPVVVAKGADHIAEKIMETARAYGVPIVRRPELARTIFSTVQIGQAVPQELYIAVAEVLAMLHRLRQRRR